MSFYISYSIKFEGHIKPIAFVKSQEIKERQTISQELCRLLHLVSAIKNQISAFKQYKYNTRIILFLENISNLS